MKTIARVATLLALFAAALPTTAQTWPAKQPIRLVVPFPPGGGTDIVARRFAEHLRGELGQMVIVDNKAGASGNIGADAVAKATPDGYTLLLTAAPFAIAPAMFKKLSFDPVKDFTPVVQLATVPLLLVTRADSPLNSVADLIAQARKEPDGLTYATFGNGSPPHLVGESMKLLTGTRITHVPYKGGQAALPDILSGQISVAIMDVVSMTPLLKAGRLKALAITGPKRAPALPDVPTLSQSGISFDSVGWYAVFGPAGLPADIAQRLNAASNKVMARPDMQTLLRDNGSIAIEPPTGTAQWTRQFGEDVRTWAKVAQDSGATVD
ncbi:MAG: tripartite tricarboxylate transporter substrate binding protein [Pseudomonadota bacterium]